MFTLKQLRKDIEFNHQLINLIDALKGVALSQFRHLQSRREYSARFNRCLGNFFEMTNLIDTTHPFFTLKEAAPCGIVMITSDEGFLGGLNSRIIDAGLSRYKEKDELIVIGDKGANLLEEKKFSFLYFPGLTEEIKYIEAEGLRDYLIQQYLKERFAKLIIVYPKFVSFVHQEVKIEQLLPYSRLSVNGYRLMADEENRVRIPDGEGNVSSAVGRETTVLAKILQPEVIIEPNEERIMDYLIRVWMAQKIYEIFWESKLSEWASRVIHLEGSSRTISESNKKLRFFYFRTLHQISDKNIREIIASRLLR